MLQIQSERYRSDPELLPGLSLQGQPQGKFVMGCPAVLEKMLGNNDMNALSIHR